MRYKLSCEVYKMASEVYKLVSEVRSWPWSLGILSNLLESKNLLESSEIVGIIQNLSESCFSVSMFLGLEQCSVIKNLIT